MSTSFSFLHKLATRIIAVSLLILPFTLISPSIYAQDDSVQVMKSFTNQSDQAADAATISDESKKIVMFVMGVPLLILLLITGGLGIAMGIYCKQVFVPHMIFAGLSLTLALAHAIVGLVWFYPF